MERLILSVLEDEYLLHKVVDSADDFDNHEVAVESAKKGYYSFLLLLSSNGKVYNHTRAECLRHIDDPSISIHLIRDIVTDMAERGEVDGTVSLMTKVMVDHYASSQHQDMTLEDALFIIDSK